MTESSVWLPKRTLHTGASNKRGISFFGIIISSRILAPNYAKTEGRIHSPRFLVPFPSGDKDPPPAAAAAAAKSVPSPATPQPQPIIREGRRKQLQVPLSGATKDSDLVPSIPRKEERN